MNVSTLDLKKDINQPLTSKYQKIKIATHQLLEANNTNLKYARVFHTFMLILISCNVLAVILETVDSLFDDYSDLFTYFEYFSVTCFSMEYLLRIWCCNINKKFSGSLIGRIKFILTPMALVDLLSIAPFYLPMITDLDLRFLRAIRLSRIFRLFKIGRYSNAYILIRHVIILKKEYLVITTVFGATLLIVASSLMYFIEHEAQPQVFSSIPTTMWWGIITLTTVGYGDTVPITPLGKFLSGLLALLGIGLFALPAGILASGFSEEIQKQKCESLCPHCGKNINHHS
jgi:voltage-gated potassium channel